MSLRDVLGVAQDADLFEDAPCTDLSSLLWDPRGEREKQPDANARHKKAAMICRSECPAITACAARMARMRAAKRLTAGVWAGQVPSRGGARPVRSECGTDGGYQRHHRLGEPVCDACAVAHRAYMREYMAARRSS